MKFYNSVGPNPRVVKMFMAERGISIPTETVDLMGGANRAQPYLGINPAGQTPALEMENGANVSEITAICEYLDEKSPGDSLIGATPEERAITRMWTRRVDLKVAEPMANGFRFSEGLPLFQNRTRCVPEAAPGLKTLAQDGMAYVEANMVGPFLTGPKFTLADVLLFCFVDFGGQVGQPLDPALTKVNAWYAAVKARPSAAASA